MYNPIVYLSEAFLMHLLNQIPISPLDDFILLPFEI
uniref:Uncharacterized protein n=1 Tax=Myoviridae sp. ct3pM2 TaxID=2827658 RepID=A0A8S5TDU4_9CAUD|nr:MAG TPA: hypothetical protein [Myoviridae sp. ct3pM2]